MKDKTCLAVNIRALRGASLAQVAGALLLALGPHQGLVLAQAACAIPARCSVM